MVNLLDIYARASRRLPLTPGERAMLKTADTLLLASLGGAAVAVLQAILGGGQPISLTSLGQVAIYAATTALVTGLAKLFRARGDALSLAVASALDQASARIAQPPAQPQRAPVNMSAMAAASAQRIAALRGSGVDTSAIAALANPASPAPPPTLDATTRPVIAASVASATTGQAQAPQVCNEAPAPPAPSQTVAAPADDEDDDGPVTAVMAVVRPSSAPAGDAVAVGVAEATGPVAPPAPASPREWTC
jgi:hypothetical protein